MRERIGIKAKDWKELFKNFVKSNEENQNFYNVKESENYIKNATEISKKDKEELEKVLADLEKKAVKLENRKSGERIKKQGEQKNKVKYNDIKENKGRSIEESKGREKE